MINGVSAKGCLVVGLRDLKTHREVILVLFSQGVIGMCAKLLHLWPTLCHIWIKACQAPLAMGYMCTTITLPKKK